MVVFARVGQSCVLLTLCLFSQTLFADSRFPCLMGDKWPTEGLNQFQKEQITILRRRISEYQSLNFSRNKGQAIIQAVGVLPAILGGSIDGDHPCISEFLRFIRSQVIRTSAKVSYSPLLVAFVRAVGKVPNYRNAMPRKFDFLQKLFLMKPERFTEWHDDTDLSRPTSPLELEQLKLLLAQTLAADSTAYVLNVWDFREFLLKHMVNHHSLEMRNIMKKAFDNHLRLANSRDRGRDDIKAWNTQLTRWLKEITKLLEEQSATTVYPAYFVFNVIEQLGKYAGKYGVGVQAVEFMKVVNERQGDFPLLRNFYQGPQLIHTLALKARIDLGDLGSSGASASAQSVPSVGCEYSLTAEIRAATAAKLKSRLRLNESNS